MANMTQCAARLVCLGLAFLHFLVTGPAAIAGADNTSNPPLLGSSDAAPSPQHPFGFRGDGSGRFPGATPALSWSADKNVRWSVLVGAGYSSPILIGDCVVVESEPDLLVCLARFDGRERWRLKTKPADVLDEAQRKAAAAYEPPKNGSGLAAATPITDGTSIYAVFANGIIRAVGTDGKPRWTACVDAPPNTGYGRASSPILVDGKLIVHMTGLYAFDPATGKQLWKNTDAKSTYATPIALKIGADELIVTPAGDVVRAVDGKTVATSIATSDHSSPIVGPDEVIYFASDSTNAIRLGAKFKDEEVWNAPGTGDTFSSPLLVEGVLFVVNGDGKLSAFDATGKGDLMPLIDGRPLFDSRPAGPAVFSSITLGGKYLFVCSNSGETVVLEATRDAKVVSRNRLPPGSGASPVFSGKSLFLRDGDRLICIE